MVTKDTEYVVDKGQNFVSPVIKQGIREIYHLFNKRGKMCKETRAIIASAIKTNVEGAQNFAYDMRNYICAYLADGYVMNHPSHEKLSAHRVVMDIEISNHGKHGPRAMSWGDICLGIPAMRTGPTRMMLYFKPAVSQYHRSTSARKNTLSWRW